MTTASPHYSLLQDQRNVLVSGLSRHVTENHLIEIFECFGHVLSVFSPPKSPEDCMAIRMSSAAEAKNAALSMDRGQLDGKELWVAAVAVEKERCQKFLEIDDHVRGNN